VLRKTCCLEIARSSPAAVGPNRGEDLLPGEDLLTGHHKGPSAGIDPIIGLSSAAAQTTNDPADLLSSAWQGANERLASMFVLVNLTSRD
jgi:hypothetical protein